MGVERFFLYNNLSDDDHLEVLAPYIGEGIVTVHDWPLPFPDGMTKAFAHCLAEHGEESRWIAFIDVDEFLFSPTGRPLPELLADYEGRPGIGVNRTSFGSSGHRTKPPGLVIENFVHRRNDSRNSNLFIKSIVDPAQVASPGNHCHYFVYRDGLAVDENQRLIEGPRFSVTESVSYSKLRINHYVSKSGEEYRRKAELWTAAGSPKSWETFEERLEMLNEERDETITTWVPAVREAMRRDQARA